jgi:WD40 repeat protein
MLAVGTRNGKVRFWDFDSRREEPSISVTTNPVFPVFSPDDRTLLTVDNQSLAKLWDLTTRRETADLSLGNRTFWYRSAAFSTNGNRLALGLQDRESALDTLALWDTVNRKWINQVEGRWTGIGELAFSPDGNRLASALGDGTARIWNLPDFQSDMSPLKGPVMSMDCVGFSPDGTRLVTGGDHGIVQLWDTKTGQQVGALKAQEKACEWTFFASNDALVTVGWEPRVSQPVSAILWQAWSLEDIRAEERRQAILQDMRPMK